MEAAWGDRSLNQPQVQKAVCCLCASSTRDLALEPIALVGTPPLDRGRGANIPMNTRLV
jgi:hypothetical protein